MDLKETEESGLSVGGILVSRRLEIVILFNLENSREKHDTACPTIPPKKVRNEFIK